MLMKMGETDGESRKPEFGGRAPAITAAAQHREGRAFSC